MALVDASTGQVAASYRYDLWGNPLSASGAAAGACPFGLAGMYRDAETGLYHTPNREYSPTQHRWLTRDPSGEAGGVDLYAYCGNDPVNSQDTSGLAPGMGLSPAYSGHPHALSDPPIIRLPWACLGGPGLHLTVLTATSAGSLRVFLCY